MASNLFQKKIFKQVLIFLWITFHMHLLGLKTSHNEIVVVYISARIIGSQPGSRMQKGWLGPWH